MSLEKLANYPICELEELKEDIEQDVYKFNKIIKDLRMKILKLELEQQDREKNLLEIKKIVFELTPKIKYDNNDEDDFNPFDIEHVSAKS